MNSPFDLVLKIDFKASYMLASACLLAGIVLSIVYLQVEASTDGPSPHLLKPPQPTPDCTPPSDWGKTVRLVNPHKPTKQWTFDVVDPMVDVTLGFFYYQDYDKSGCPFDCSTGECQTDEGGKGSSPLGEFFVLDGKEGANRGVKKLRGRLAKGTYQVSFTATGFPGSINVGLNVRTDPVPTPTPKPTKTPTPTKVPETPTATHTPTATGTQPIETPTFTPSGTITGTIPPPSDTPTPTKTAKYPTPTATRVRKTPPSTLPPPTPFPGTPTPQILIPVTGIGIGQVTEIGGWILIPFGLGILGLGIALYGIAVRLKQN